MSTGDSKAQKEHERENAIYNKKVNKGLVEDKIVDNKKLEGPNRPAE
jgi:hypothetical protein